MPKQALASCTTSVYVNLSKNSLLTPPFPKAGAKVHTFSELTKLFLENFHLSCTIFSTLDKYQDTKQPTPYYIYKRKQKGEVRLGLLPPNERRKERPGRESDDVNL